VKQSLLAASLVVAASVLGGCSTIAHAIWPCIQPVCPPGRLTRETPDDAVDFLIDAFKNRRITDIYDSFHPEFIREKGGFSLGDFTLAYEHFEQDFVADAESLANAGRGWMEPQQSAIGVLAGVRLRNTATGAEIVFALQNHPKIRVVTTDRFVGMIEGPVDKSVMLRLEGGRLGLPADFPLTSIDGVSPQTVAGLDASKVVRVEIADDWLVRLVPPGSAKNIRFMDKIQEHIGK
jgi:hypothetical protein